MHWRLRDVVDGASLVEFPDAPEEQANWAAAAIARQLRAQHPAGLQDCVPGARNLLLLFDPALFDLARVRALLGASAGAARENGRSFVLPVRYGGTGGPDLDALARDAGISAAEFSRLHRTAEYRVAFIGFAPGFPYLIGLPPALHAPRLASPRPRVPAGSLGIGGQYTGVYPSSTPGGWRLIGSVPFRLFSPRADPPATLAAGDRIRFEEVDESEFAALREKLERDVLSAEPPPGTPVLRVLSAGLCTSVQGAPSVGLAASGVPSGGAMDTAALRNGNLALGNPVDACALEVTIQGPQLELLQAGRLCLSGSSIDAALNGRPVSVGEAFEARVGDRLSLGLTRSGARSYLCIDGGFVDLAAPGEPLRRLNRGDQVWRGQHTAAAPPGFDNLSRAPTGAPGTLRVVLGPQSDRFSRAGTETFLSGPYRVSSQSDRRGVRFEGPAIELSGSADIPPEGTAPGAIQVPANGLPIILGPDRPVTGGYAKIATVIGADLQLVAQARPGAVVRFRQVTIAEAVAARTS